jgi:O-antigen/teichoic acid export membrane protein
LTALTIWLCAPLVRNVLAKGGALPSWRESALKRYIPAGLSIGILSPFSVMWSRAELAHGLSWDEAAQLQALWRASEWVTGLAGGLIPLVFLPRMAAAVGRTAFLHELTRTWRTLWIPGALSIALLWAGQGVVMPLLYSEKFLMPALASGLFLLGDALRLACWVPLHGLFATERVNAVAIGEWLSLPLFAALLTATGAHSLVIAGACYAVTYAIYLAFNVWCIFRTPGRYATATTPIPSPLVGEG